MSSCNIVAFSHRCFCNIVALTFYEQTFVFLFTNKYEQTFVFCSPSLLFSFSSIISIFLVKTVKTSFFNKSNIYRCFSVFCP